MESLTKISGTHYLWQGFVLITKPTLRSFVIIPLLINFLLFFGLIFIGVHYFNEVINWTDHLLPRWLQWLNSLLWLLFAITLAIIFIFCFTTLANIIGAPFYSLLTSKVELYLTKQALLEESWIASISDIPRTLTREWQKLIYFIPRAILCLILYWIPLVQLIASALWFLFNAWIMAIQYLDYPADNHKMPFKTFLSVLSKYRMPVLGFGIWIMILSFIPIVNCFLMPAAVAGSTAMWVDVLQPSSKKIKGYITCNT